MSTGSSLCLAAAVVAVLSVLPEAAFPAPPARPRVDLASLGLEDLANLEVTTVSRKSQRLNDAAAAVFVITSEDIRRSGATSVPDVLRMVPGMQVGRIATDKWAVSARGFAGRYSNKLLVQVDGRSIYSQLFSGVQWEAQDMLLEDIERIEVIRGPGAALWGANAVNGVINIITKRAQDTQGTFAQLAAGTQEKGIAALRYGGGTGDDTHYRVHAKGYARNESVDMNGAGAADDSRSQHAGFRLDRRVRAGERLTVSGNAYEAHSREYWVEPRVLPPYSTTTPMTERNHGVSLAARYDRALEDGSDVTLQAYVESTGLKASPFASERRETYDLDFQHRLRLGAGHDVVWGMNYRVSRDDITTPEPFLQITPQRENFRIASVFLHDEISVVPERVRLILGAKLEHNSFTGLEPQPNLRLLWTPDASHAVWAAWSRAVRTPSRGDRESVIDLAVTPPFSAANPSPFPVLLRSTFLPGDKRSSERLTAFELGYRAQLDPRLSFDVAAFANRYTELRSNTPGPVQFQPVPVPYLIQLAYLDNGLSGRTRGLEASLDWRPVDRWRLQASYTLLHMDIPTSSSDELHNGLARFLNGSAPRNQLSLRSMLDLSPGHQFDLWLRHASGMSWGNVPSHLTLDLRYGWRPTKGFELSFVGQNLLERRHPEFLMDNVTSPLLQVQSGFYVQAKWWH